MPRVTGKGEYTDDWKDIADQVKDDAHWCCIRCGEADSVEGGHVLTVHHFTGDKSNNERWNLMPLCQRCHLSVQGRVDPEIPLMFEPATWAMPYLAGFYEAGRGVPGPLYVLDEWIERYELEGFGRWPDWAPRVDCANNDTNPLDTD